MLLGGDAGIYICRTQKVFPLRWCTFTYTNTSLSKEIIKFLEHYLHHKLEQQKVTKKACICSHQIFNFLFSPQSNIHRLSECPSFAAGGMKISKCQDPFICFFLFFLLSRVKLSTKHIHSLRPFPTWTFLEIK